jgi:hypothetical protein
VVLVPRVRVLGRKAEVLVVVRELAQAEESEAVVAPEKEAEQAKKTKWANSNRIS